MAMLLQEYTPKEIAAALHLDRDACRGRINRARRRFQKYYERA
jgi:DNA-directed RNA polymerase specialized sigma24 family protein